MKRLLDIGLKTLYEMDKILVEAPTSLYFKIKINSCLQASCKPNAVVAAQMAIHSRLSRLRQKCAVTKCSYSHLCTDICKVERHHIAVAFGSQKMDRYH